MDKIFHLLPEWLKDLVNGDGFAEMCADLFDKVDTDRNGTLSPDELFPVIEDLVNEHPMSITISHCKAFADVFDANKDGVISREEAKNFVKFILCYEVLEADPELLKRCLAYQEQYEASPYSYEVSLQNIM